LITLAIFSDAHTNSTVGLSMPSVELQEGDKVVAGSLRSWIFHSFMDLLEQIDKKKRGELYGVLNGDMIEVDAKHRTIQTLSRDVAEINRMATDLWEPFFQSAARVWVVRGTEAHVGANSQAEELLAANFDNTVKNEETGKATWAQLLLDVDGVRLDIMHHPSGGMGRAINSHGIADRLAVDTLFEYANAGEVIPNLVIRSHLHRYVDSHDAYRVRAIITPALTFNTSYIFRIGVSRQNDIGGLLIHCDGGEYEVEPLLYKARRPEWQIH
jgi:hypothetical protein